MRLITIAATAMLMLASGSGMAQSTGSGSTAGGSAAVGSTTTPGSTTGSTTTTGSATTGAGSPNYNAGGIAAGANSTANPSGNSLINPSPSGSTLNPTGPGTVGR